MMTLLCCLSLFSFHVAVLIVSRRFLRARRFVPQDALQQFTDTELWRESNKIGDLYNNIDIKDYEETRRLVSMGIDTPTHPAVY